MTVTLIRRRILHVIPVMTPQIGVGISGERYFNTVENPFRQGQQFIPEHVIHLPCGIMEEGDRLCIGPLISHGLPLQGVGNDAPRHKLHRAVEHPANCPQRLAFGRIGRGAEIRRLSEDKEPYKPLTASELLFIESLIVRYGIEGTDIDVHPVVDIKLPVGILHKNRAVHPQL